MSLTTGKGPATLPPLPPHHHSFTDWDGNPTSAVSSTDDWKFRSPADWKFRSPTDSSTDWNRNGNRPMPGVDSHSRVYT